MQVKLKIRKGDTVKVLSGNSKGKEGKVLDVNLTTMRVIVEGVNIVHKHTKPSATNPQGGIVEKEAPIHVSNLVLLVDGVATKVGRKKDENNKLVRYAKKTGEVIK
jgi:large subunit ribosomal protein L24